LNLFPKLFFSTVALLLTLSTSPICDDAVAQSITLSKNLPTDQRYWDYQKDYENRTLLNVIISGDNMAHVVSVLGELQAMENRGVSIGEVIILSTRWDPKAGGSTPALRHSPESQQILAEKVSRMLSSSKLKSLKVLDGRALIERYDIQYSPTWVVYHRGENHVHEGLTKPQRLFTSEGVYRVR
jgi:hypothetical protein